MSYVAVPAISGPLLLTRRARVPRGPALWAGCAAADRRAGGQQAVAATVTAWALSSNDRLTVALAVLSIFIIDFAVNAVQATDRVLLVDTLPPSAPAAGNACAAPMLGTGSVVGFFRVRVFATLPLPTLLPFLHAASSLEALAPLVSLLFIAYHLITALLVPERVLLGGSANNNPSLITTLRDIWSNARTL
ncbi:hypothetical protein C8J57DRAFT_1660261 [Mycena rebaudengoi]|nr:hypothetical protein C8J57DRAFT_1660261 [Mycena rebaudengoi]